MTEQPKQRQQYVMPDLVADLWWLRHVTIMVELKMVRIFRAGGSETGRKIWVPIRHGRKVQRMIHDSCK
jgi:hypothetical protein